MAFTTRELEVLRFLATHNPTPLKDVAHELGMGIGTLKQHLTAMYEKFGFYGVTSLRKLELWARSNLDLLDPQKVA